MKDCPACGEANPQRNKFCGECGAALTLSCTACGAESAPGKKFCGDCGASLSGTTAQSPKATEQPAARQPVRPPAPPVVEREPERRQLTVIHIDLVGSTALSQSLELEDYRDAMRAYIATSTRTIEEAGGIVSDVSGDGLLAFFGYPRASEDDAVQAVRAALSITAEVAELRPGNSMAARAGIATGMVVVGREREVEGMGSHEIFGDTTNLAARLQSAAHAGGVAVCDVTQKLCRDRFRFEAMEPVAMKGFERPQRASLAFLPSDQPSANGMRGPDVPLLGRDEEIDLLKRRWREAAGGRGRVVLLSGEPGIGKSHIMSALTGLLAGEAYTPLRYFCSSHHVHSALRPFAEQIERAAGFRRTDGPAERLDKIAGLFAGSTDELTVPLVADLVNVPHESEALAGLSPQARKERLFAVLLAELDRLAGEGPILLTFEDVHWIDPTSLELLAATVERLPGLPVLAVITARPEFAAPWPDHAHISTVLLKRLDSELGHALIARVTGNKALPDAVIDQILARADGVPLFIEELTKTVVESELMVEREGRFELTGPLPELSIPTTLHASLLARLDRLDHVREVAQVGSALGRDFPFRLIERVSRLGREQLIAALEQLNAAGVVLSRGVPPDAQYFFKHALLRDAAYSGMLKGRRTELHGAIASALAEDFQTLVEAEPETLAYHLSEAGRAGEAAQQWLRAGRNAIRASANVEAIAHLTHGIGMTANLPESPDRDRLELDLQFALGPCRIAATGPASAASLETFARARELCERLGSPEEHLQVMFWMSTSQVIRGELPEAAESVEALRRIAESREDKAALINAQRGAGMITLFMGRLEQSHAYFRDALALFDVLDEADRTKAMAAGQDAGASSHAVLSWVLHALGEPDDALRHSEAGVTRADAVGHPHTRAYVYYYKAVLRALVGDHAEARAAADLCHRVSEEHGFRHWVGLAGAVRAIADAELDVQKAPVLLDEAARALAAYRKAGYQLGVTALYVLLSRALLRTGESAAALELLDHGSAFVAENSEKLFEAEILRLRAEAVGHGGMAAGRESAADLLDRASAVARAQGAAGAEAAIAASRQNLGADARLH